MLTRPEVIGEIHRRYLEAGADIIETNTFNSNATSQADYGLEALVRELNLDGRADRAPRGRRRDRAHRPAALRGRRARPDEPHRVAVADVNDPGFRNISFDELVATYAEATHALVDGGVDLLLVETIFDTLNAKAALFAVRAGARRARARPADHDLRHDHGRVGAHAVGADGRGVLEFRAARAPAVIGLNCALGAKQLRPYVEELSRIADAYVCAYPERRPAERLRRVRRDGVRDGRPRAGVRARAASSTSWAAAAARRRSTSRTSRESVAGVPPRKPPVHRARVAG